MRTHTTHSRPAAREIRERFRSSTHKLTGPRQAILAFLSRSDGPLSIKEIFHGISPRCDLVTVYRSMYLLEKMQLVKRFDLGDGVARFEALSAGDDGHHHHLVCTQCAGVVEIEECFPQQLEEKIATQNGFKAVTHRLEFFGVCPRCQ